MGRFFWNTVSLHAYTLIHDSFHQKNVILDSQEAQRPPGPTVSINPIFLSTSLSCPQTVIKIRVVTKTLKDITMPKKYIFNSWPVFLLQVVWFRYVWLCIIDTQTTTLFHSLNCAHFFSLKVLCQLSIYSVEMAKLLSLAAHQIHPIKHFNLTHKTVSETVLLSNLLIWNIACCLMNSNRWSGNVLITTLIAKL